MELRGCLSKSEIGRIIRNVQDLIDGKQVPQTPCHEAVVPRDREVRQQVRTRLGDDKVAELIAEFVAGTTMRELVDRYGVSLSSLKRLLRGSGSSRGDPPGDEPRR